MTRLPDAAGCPGTNERAASDETARGEGIGTFPGLRLLHHALPQDFQTRAPSGSIPATIGAFRAFRAVYVIFREGMVLATRGSEKPAPGPPSTLSRK